MSVKQGIWLVVVNYFRRRTISDFVKNYIGVAINRIRKKGLKRSIMIFISFIGDFSFDFRYGTNTINPVTLNDLEIQSDNKLRGYKYGPTQARPFKQLMNTLNFPDNSVFVDFGSGKGRVLLLSSQYGFKRVVGIEFSPKLCEIAKKNLSIYKKKVGGILNVQIIESDVVDYNIRDDDNVFFLYNPFDRVVMRIILNNIILSLKNKQRKIWLIYNNPIYRDIIENKGVFTKLKESIHGSHEIVVYVNINNKIKDI